MTKIYHVQAADPGKEAKTFQEATALAQGNAVSVPAEALTLAVKGGKIEKEGGNG